jgi:hypothetical protein
MGAVGAIGGGKAAGIDEWYWTEGELCYRGKCCATRRGCAPIGCPALAFAHPLTLHHARAPCMTR